MPPGNFPSGCEPLFVDSFEEAVKEARKRTNEGILVIDSITMDKKDFYDVLNQLNENGKVYKATKNDFEKDENPYRFLLNGNVLFIDTSGSYGFDWSTVIVFEQGINVMASHNCNYMLRCTTNLIVVKRKESDIDDIDSE